MTDAQGEERDAIAAFRGSGNKGTVSQLLADRRAELNAETEYRLEVISKPSDS